MTSFDRTARRGFTLGEMVVALLLSRQLDRMRSSRLRELIAFYLCGLTAYGLANIANSISGPMAILIGGQVLT
jgi:hypothetical protein